MATYYPTPQKSGGSGGSSILNYLNKSPGAATGAGGAPLATGSMAGDAATGMVPAAGAAASTASDAAIGAGSAAGVGAGAGAAGGGASWLAGL